MRIAIIGFGREGKSVLKYLRRRRSGFMKTRRGADEIWILDRNEKLAIPKGVNAQLGENYLKRLERFDLVFRSPGIPWNLPKLKKARSKGVRFSSATKLFFEISPARIIGITGTKGKGTVATLLYKMLKADGKDVYLAGNIGISPLEILPKLKKNSLVVLELSSFQLQDITRSPQIAAVLDIFPDHQDNHQNLREYYIAKSRIVKYQRPVDKIFFFSENKISAKIASQSKAKKYPVTYNRFVLFSEKDLKLKGVHNFKNAVMAASIAQALGVADRVIVKTVRAFRGLEHRMEFVRRIGEIDFYNDSASTNPQAAAAAVLAFKEEPKVLIAGGQDKGANYSPLAKALKYSNTKLVVLIGNNKKKIRKAIQKSGVKIENAENLKIAVSTAYRFARSYLLNSKSCKIILSPGAASFDMFQNYSDRGKKFKQLVRRLKKSYI